MLSVNLTGSLICKKSLSAIFVYVRSQDQNVCLVVLYSWHSQENITKIAQIFFGRACCARIESQCTFSDGKREYASNHVSVRLAQIRWLCLF